MSRRRVARRCGLVLVLVTTAVATSSSQSAAVSVTRLQGADRYETAAAVADQVRADGLAGSTVLLTTGENFPDAVVAGGWRSSGVILLTRKSQLPAATLDLLNAGWVTSVYAIGGTAVIDESILDEIRGLGLPVTRLAGGDRYATSLAVSAATNPTGGTQDVWVSPGTSFADQLVAAAGARRTNGAMLLARPNAELSADQLAEISRVTQGRQPTIHVIDSLVSLSQVKVPGATVRRYSASPYDLALDVQTPGPDVVVASGENWPDALAGTRLVTSQRALLLSKKDCAPARVSTVMAAAATLTALGGPMALSNAAISGTVCPAPTSFDTPFTIYGTGDRYIDFTIPFDSAAVLDITYTGPSNFSIISRLAGDEYGDLLVNEIGNYSGRVFVPNKFDISPELVRYLEVNASGPWQIIAMPIGLQPQFPSTASGQGDEVLRVATSSNRVTFTHNGTSNFIVWAHGFYSYGMTRDLLINEIGAYNGQVPLPAGTFIFEILADGDWTITPG